MVWTARPSLVSLMSVAPPVLVSCTVACPDMLSLSIRHTASVRVPRSLPAMMRPRSMGWSINPSNVTEYSSCKSRCRRDLNALNGMTETGPVPVMSLMILICLRLLFLYRDFCVVLGYRTGIVVCAWAVILARSVTKCLGEMISLLRRCHAQSRLRR